MDALLEVLLEVNAGETEEITGLTFDSKEVDEDEEAEAEEAVVSVKRLPPDFSVEIVEEAALVKSFVPLEIDEITGITRVKKDGSNIALDISGNVEDEELDDDAVETTVSSTSGTAERLETDEDELDEEELAAAVVATAPVVAVAAAVVATAPVADVAAAVVVVVVVIVDGTSSIKTSGSLTTVAVEVKEDVLTVQGNSGTDGTIGS